MDGLQPLLHDLTALIAAPLQLWTARDGSIRDHGIQGLSIGDERVLAGYDLSSRSYTIDHLRATTQGAATQVLTSILRRDDQPVDPEIVLNRERTLESGALTETLHLTNASDRVVSTTVEILLRPDGTDMERIKQGRAAHRQVTVSPAGWSWRTGCHVQVRTDARVTVDGDLVALRWPVRVAPSESWRGWLTLAPEIGDAIVQEPRARYLRAAGTRFLATVGAPGDDLTRQVERALQDLDGLLMARTARPDATFLAAGAPWFFTLFGRDSIIAASMLLPVTTDLANSTLQTLADLQGRAPDPATGEEPGKIPHEIRRTPLRLRTENGWMELAPVYYGTIDATCLWISLLHDAYRAGMPESDTRRLLPHLLRALGWLRDFADPDGDGFLEYFDASGRGLANQGWKDSGDSIRWADGSLAHGPIALVEVQGYAHRAALDAAQLLDVFGAAVPGLDADGAAREADAWRGWAAALTERFRAAFWVRDAQGPYPAIALDHEKRPVDSVSSNIGHLLGTGLLSSAEEDAIVRRLMTPALRSGFGVRTIDVANGGYWPLRYHAGSVWPHDTALTIRGMLETGHGAQARALAADLHRAITAFEGRLPELFGGWDRSEFDPPIPYPAACRPQAWSAAATIVVAAALTR